MLNLDDLLCLDILITRVKKQKDEETEEAEETKKERGK